MGRISELEEEVHLKDRLLRSLADRENPKWLVAKGE
jgi:hypothetical protein